MSNEQDNRAIMKPKLLYIGHAFHNKTKSSLFVQNLLSEKYEVTKFDYDPHNEGYDVFSRLNSQRFDVVVLFQTMPSLSLLGKHIEIDKVAFFPMYDSALKLKNPIWSEYRNVNIINFSLTLHKKCKEYGLSSYYIQYFPKPIKVNNWGDENSVFLWQRKEEINPHTIEKTIGEKNKYKILNWIQADAKKNNDPELMDSKLSIKQPKRFAIKLPLLKRIYTRKYEIFYIFGFIPIKIPNRNREKI